MAIYPGITGRREKLGVYQLGQQRGAVYGEGSRRAGPAMGQEEKPNQNEL